MQKQHSVAVQMCTIHTGRQGKCLRNSLNLEKAIRNENERGDVELLPEIEVANVNHIQLEHFTFT